MVNFHEVPAPPVAREPDAGVLACTLPFRRGLGFNQALLNGFDSNLYNLTIKLCARTAPELLQTERKRLRQPVYAVRCHGINGIRHANDSC